jgi:hypothetical protein
MKTISVGEIKFEVENCSINQFAPMGERPSPTIPGANEHYPNGETIIIITSNAPKELQEEIHKLVAKHCNHGEG